MERLTATARMPSIVLGPHDGDATVTPDDRPAALLVDGSQTGGAFTATEVVVPAATAGTTYVHHEADECFYVLVGELSIEVDDREEAVWLRPHSLLYVPRGLARTVHNGSASPARLLLLQTPGRCRDDPARSGVELVPVPSSAAT